MVCQLIGFITKQYLIIEARMRNFICLIAHSKGAIQNVKLVSPHLIFE